MTGALEPGLQRVAEGRQAGGVVGVVGWDGGHRVAGRRGGLVQVGLLAGALGLGVQREAEVGQAHRLVGVVEWGGRYRIAEKVDGLGRGRPAGR
ncbi:MAG: hypothetical protein M3O70_21155 [Actinomycetota bacterium]|nr:hypothetical protein [Actinomycetota bacterium]